MSICIDHLYRRKATYWWQRRGPSALEAEIFWSTFLKSPLRRGLRGIKLVISDAHDV